MGGARYARGGLRVTKPDVSEIVAAARLVFREKWREDAKGSLHVDDERLDRLIDGSEDISETMWEGFI